MGIIKLKENVIQSWLKNKSTPPRNYEELADAIGVSPSLITLMLKGERTPTPSVQKKLCELTGYDVGDLCHYDRNAESKEDNNKDK